MRYGSAPFSVGRGAAVPSPLRVKSCEQCGVAWETRCSSARTCSPLCRARLREAEHGPTRTKRPRDYDPDLVRQVRELYESGMTRAEVQAEIGPGAKVENIMRRYGITPRPAVKRDQRGERNHSWRGSEAGYKALHLRVAAERGKPSKCRECGRSDSAVRYEWANLTGDYADIWDYARMCVPCHRLFDSVRRSRAGARTSPDGR